MRYDIFTLLLKRVKMARKKKENLVHLDLESLSEEVKEPVSKKQTKEEDKTLGELLRQTREKKRYHLQTIAKRLRIKPIYLEALEKGHYYAFPGLVYGVGFLRSYAQFLGLDVKDVMERFHAETSSIKAQPLEMPIPENRNILPSTKTVIKSVLFLIIVYLLWYIVDSFLQPTIQKPLPKVSAVIEEKIKTEQPVVESVIAEPVVEKNEAPVVEAPRSVSVYGLKEPAIISFIATDETWVEVTDTDTERIVLSKVLYAGDSYNPPVDSDEYILKTGNAGGLDVYINGQKIKTLGKTGELKSGIVLTKKALRKL